LCSLCESVLPSVPAFRNHIMRRHGVRGVKNVLETYGRHIGGGSSSGGGGD
jgi:hypothetical protein